jgi:hypothetical protein
MKLRDSSRGHLVHAIVAAIAAAAILTFACSDDTTTAVRQDTPIPAIEGATVYTIEATTQLHLRGVAIGVGNIWEEQYIPEGGTSMTGLTAGLFLTVQNDASQSRTLRVHPGTDIVVANYRLQVLSVETRGIQLAVFEGPP